MNVLRDVTVTLLMLARARSNNYHGAKNIKTWDAENIAVLATTAIRLYWYLKIFPNDE